MLQVQIKQTCNIARLIGEEAARRDVKAYVRLQQPWYESSDKGSHSEQEDVKPYGVIGTWWHESLRILGTIEGCVHHLSVLSPILTCVSASTLLSSVSASFMDLTLISASVGGVSPF